MYICWRQRKHSLPSPSVREVINKCRCSTHLSVRWVVKRMYNTACNTRPVWAQTYAATDVQCSLVGWGLTELSTQFRSYRAFKAIAEGSRDTRYQPLCGQCKQIICQPWRITVTNQNEARKCRLLKNSYIPVHNPYYTHKPGLLVTYSRKAFWLTGLSIGSKPSR